MSSAVWAALMLTVLTGSFATDTLIRAKLPAPSEDYVHWTSLDEAANYFVHWKFDDKSVTFEVQVRTRGWVGLGFSKAGAMRGSDVVIGWVANGKGYFKDRHAVGNERPVIDESQDYQLLHAHETDDFTSLKFKRPLINCDDHDFDIEQGTVRLIFAWGDSDPDDHESVQYHGATQRGSKSIVILDNTKPDRKKQKELTDDKDVQSFDILIHNATLTTERTVYFCRFMSLPKLEKKHHVIKIEPMIQKKNIGVVHHIVIYQCRGTRNFGDRVPRRCWEGGMPDNATKCDTIMFAWGVGQTAYYLPEEAGIPIGEDVSPLMQIEIHYDNPMHLSDVVDNSGVRIVYTPHLRKHDAGMLAIGHTVQWPKLVIPPGHEAFELNTYCRKECTQKMIPSSGIHLIGVMLHTHLLGEKIWLKHVRDGKELPEIVRDDYYDFNYQQMQYLNEFRHIKPGDEFVLTCVYNSKKRKLVTLGGSGTDNEMCVAFALYYPLIPMVACMSTTQDFFPIHQMVVEKAMAGELTIDANSDDYDAYKYLNKFKWNDELREEFYRKTVKNINGVRQTCSARGKGEGFFGGGFYRYIRKVEIKEPWQRKSQCPVKKVTSGASYQRVVPMSVVLAVVIAILVER